MLASNSFNKQILCHLTLGFVLYHVRVSADELRNRSAEHKAAIVAEAERHIWPAIEAAEAHSIIERSIHIDLRSDANNMSPRAFTLYRAARRPDPDKNPGLLC
ncbi:NADPH2:quinone reductase [Dendrobium catenatum]|uniref:NADPH2:quinone reductase n=1 Tax=Dendrobium catenatum TaxID=906689 RepID=A0A2I0W2V1_9ASPA|nr:NADPH2:quinone reductase [Dendrobium catenatum]